MQAYYCTGFDWGRIILYGSWCEVGVGFVLETFLTGIYSLGFHAASHVGQRGHSM